MYEINIDKLIKLNETAVEYKLLSHLPTEGVEPLRTLMIFIKEFYSTFPPEQIEGNFLILYCNSRDEYPSLNTLHSLDQRNGQLHQMIRFPAVILLFEDKNYKLLNNLSPNIPQIFNDNTLAYQLNQSEQIWIGNQRFELETSAARSRSLFSLPTFWDLEAALNAYYHSEAKECACTLINSAWNDQQRIHWRNGPEHLLRDSLWRYLRTTFRGALVNREQNVTDNNPVDIKVIWQYSNAIGLIEIKWLGVSINEQRSITNNHTNSRAQNGATQLRDYINRANIENPEAHHKGFLVVYDGRRRCARNLTHTVTTEEAWHYRYIELSFQDEHRRFDLSLDNRFFIYPAIALN